MAAAVETVTAVADDDDGPATVEMMEVVVIVAETAGLTVWVPACRCSCSTGCR